VTLDPQSWDGYAILGVNQLRIGRIDEGKATLSMAFAGAPYNVWVKNTLDLLDTFPDYVESSTERFNLMIEGGPEADLLSLYVGELAEQAYDYFEPRYGYSPPTPIRIEVYPSHADFSVRTVGLAGLGALGVSFGPVIAIDSPSARPLGEFNWGTTLWHEIAHTFTLGTTDFRIPRWVSEGLSVYEERRARPSWGDDVTASFLIAFQRGMLQPVSRITDGLVRPAYPEQVIHSYYQASMVCELIERDWGFDGILALLDAYKRGLSTDEAFEEVLGVDAETFDRLFDEYIAEIYAGPLAALADGGEEGRENPLAGGQGVPSQYLRQMAESEPGNFRTQLAYGAALVDEERYDDAVPYLERAKQLFPQYAEADSPYAYLAMVARERGDLRRAAEELEALTDINENLYQANSRLADIYTELGEPEHAAAALERMVWIYPLDIGMHQRLAALYEETENHPLAIRERRAVVALAPADMAEAWYQLARAQYEGGEMSNARSSVLRSLEIAPSFPGAQGLLLTIVGGGGGQ
jgi:tetratricopeptide (TPR) repeat protein